MEGFTVLAVSAFGVVFRSKPNLCHCTLAVAETRPKLYVRSVSAP